MRKCGNLSIVDLPTGPGYGAARDPKTQMHKWKDKISLSKSAELDQVVSRFSLPLYPGVDPEAFTKDHT